MVYTISKYGIEKRIPSISVSWKIPDNYYSTKGMIEMTDNELILMHLDEAEAIIETIKELIEVE